MGADATGIAPLPEDVDSLGIHCESCNKDQALHHLLGHCTGQLKVKVVAFGTIGEIRSEQMRSQGLAPLAEDTDALQTRCTTCCNDQSVRLILMRCPGHLQVKAAASNRVYSHVNGSKVYNAEKVANGGKVKGGRYVAP